MDSRRHAGMEAACEVHRARRVHPPPGQPPDWADAIAKDLSFTLFDAHATQTRALMDRSDAEYMTSSPLRRGGLGTLMLPYIAAFRSFVLDHTIHRRGQLSVYLRLNDVPVSPVYGLKNIEG